MPFVLHQWSSLVLHEIYDYDYDEYEALSCEYQAMVWAVPGKCSNPEGFHTKGRKDSAILAFQ